MSKPDEENKALQELSWHIENQAHREVSEMWETRFEDRIKKLTVEMFNAWEWGNETRERFFAHQTPLQIATVAARVVSTTSLSAVKKEA